MVHRPTIHFAPQVLLLAASLLAAAPGHAYVPDALERAVAEFRLYDASRMLERYSQEQQPEDARSIYLAGRVAILNYNEDAAERAAAQCLASFPEASICHELAGEQYALSALNETGSLAQLGLARRARQAWDEAVDLDPGNIRARLQLIRYHQVVPWLAGGRKRLAKRQLDAVAEQDPSQLALAQGYHAYYGGDYDAATHRFQAVLAKEPGNAEAGYHLALAEAELGRDDAAVSHLSNVVRIFPEFWDAWFQLGTLSANTRDRSQQALNALLTFVHGAPRAGAKRLANAWNAIGRVFEQQGQTDDAMVAYSNALAEKPGHNESGEALARLQNAKHDPISN